RGADVGDGDRVLGAGRHHRVPPDLGRAHPGDPAVDGGDLRGDRRSAPYRRRLPHRRLGQPRIGRRGADGGGGGARRRGGRGGRGGLELRTRPCGGGGRGRRRPGCGDLLRDDAPARRQRGVVVRRRHGHRPGGGRRCAAVPHTAVGDRDV